MLHKPTPTLLPGDESSRVQHVHNRRGAKTETGGNDVGGEERVSSLNHAPDYNYDHISSQPIMKTVLKFLSERYKWCYLKAFSPDHILWYGATPSIALGEVEGEPF